MVISSTDIIIEKINELDITHSSKLVLIDGWMGCGKSYLLQQINALLKVQCLSLDDFLDKETGLYLEAINKSELKTKLYALTRKKVKIIIEGVCVQKVLYELGYKPDLTIYIKRLGPLGAWYESKYINETKKPEEIFVQDDKDLEIDIITGEPRVKSKEEKEKSEKRIGLFYDVVRYHYEYNPHKNSNLIYEREFKNN